MKLLTGYESGKERSALSDQAGFACVGDSMTVQAGAEEADINFIVARVLRGGELPVLDRLPLQVEFAEAMDFGTALRAIKDAEDLFMRLPAQVRSKFDNNPEGFVEYCEDPANRLELAEAGLLTKEAADAVRKQAAEAAEKAKAASGTVPGSGAAPPVSGAAGASGAP